MDCPKCGSKLHSCSDCKGGTKSGIAGKLTCNTCRNTGAVCINHGGHWKK